jgi:uncharacterized SAM-binding protein YcdF (DUF218 family)
MPELASLKPYLSALILPPVPLIGLTLIGLWLSGRRGSARQQRAGRLLGLGGLALIWFFSSLAPAVLIQDHLLRPAQSLALQRLAELQARHDPAHPVAIVVLGGGRDALASDYHGPNLSETSMTRLRYGAWLARRSGLPLGYSGGVGWAQSHDPAQPGDDSEAGIAGRILREQFGLSLRWTESRSRDTRENARLTVPMLLADGVRDMILVTHATHMPRALRQFEQAAAGRLRITPAPTSELSANNVPLLDWMPSGEGMKAMHVVLHELIGLWVTT